MSQARRKHAWRRFRVRLRETPPVRAALAAGLVGYLRLVRATNRVARGSVEPREVMTGEPMIVALWHGRHFMVPLYSPRDVAVTALVSRSADAELNAAVLERLGVECVRGSGGEGERRADKGGVGAFKALYDALGRGRTVVMIADRKPRARAVQSGPMRLARAAGVPVVPVAVSSSRAFAFPRAWDRARLNLPFGRVAIAAGEPVRVGPNDDLDAVRRAVERGLCEATARADALCGLAPAPDRATPTGEGRAVDGRPADPRAGAAPADPGSGDPAPPNGRVIA